MINRISRRQEMVLDRAIKKVCTRLISKWKTISLEHESQWRLSDVVGRLRNQYPEIDFHYYFDSSSMRPDGGILSLVLQNGTRLPILISEKKNQGTNDLRTSEGKKIQAKGNAIERLGKNVIGFRAAMKHESIFPFVCFGDGCDFADDSSILDRVVTIAMFGKLNQQYLHDTGTRGEFDRGSFYFRVKEWTEKEMEDICFEIAQRSVHYYLSKYGEQAVLSVKRPES